MQRKSPYKAIVIGSSAGGINALTKVLSVLPADFSLPIVIVQHLHPESGHHLPHILGTKSALKIKQADEKELIKKGWVYLAPPNYHLLIEEDFTFSLSLESPVNYSRPSIDVLFESAVYAYRQHLIGIILTGANHDGSLGLKKIKEMGGFTIVQDPKTAEADAMPKSAIASTQIDKILPLQDIGLYLLQLVNRKYN
jgi:two-component system chemotaxis response regulator CheB